MMKNGQDIALTEKVKIKKKKQKWDMNYLQLWSLCLIPMLLVFVFSYLPMGGAIIAFKNYTYSKGILGSSWVGFDNFKFFFQSNDFYRVTRNTLGLNALFIATGMVSSVGLALLLFELRSRTKKKIYQTLLITPNFLSWVVAAYMAYAILHPQNGTLNRLLNNLFGIQPDWYSKPEAWPVILTIANIWKNVGMDSVIYYASLMGIDSSMFEAAEVDGANKWQRTWHIVLPCLRNLVVMMTILKIGNIFRADFGLFYQLPRNIGILYPTTDVMDTYIFRAMRGIGDLSMSSAAGLFQSVVGFVLVVLTNYVSKKVDNELGLF